MRKSSDQRVTGHRVQRAFTIIELLVVMAIIALLISILLPSLSKARAHSKAVVCSSNLHHVGQAMANYLYVSKGTYPASYVYPDDDRGNWTPRTQTGNHPFGYVHWSHALYDEGTAGDKAFQCPSVHMGGAPRTNPGMDPSDWEGGQVDQNGDDRPNELEDKQAPRVAYVANAAVVPRNKFTTALSGGKRVNQFVQEHRVSHTGDTILATEFLDNWLALAIPQGDDALLVKSHRPINPFYHIGSGFDEYGAPPETSGFIYGLPNDQETYGLLPNKVVNLKANILDRSSGVAQINAVGRHHPGGDKRHPEFGGTANFLFCDGHVDPMTVLESVHRRRWGNRYYSLSGNSEVLNMDPGVTRGH